MGRLHKPEKPEDVRKRLLADGWIERKGRGDHRNFNKPGVPLVITLDMGPGSDDWDAALDLPQGRMAVVTERRAPWWLWSR